jgi:hypothetical protein
MGLTLKEFLGFDLFKEHNRRIADPMALIYIFLTHSQYFFSHRQKMWFISLRITNLASSKL